MMKFEYPAATNSDLNWAEYLEDERHQYLMGVPSDLDDFQLYDSWDIDTACQVITLSCKLDMEKQRAIKLTPITFPHLDALRARTICGVYDRARGLAESSVKAGIIKEHDTPSNWIKWAQGKGYSVAHLMIDGVAAAQVEVAQVSSLSSDDWKAQARVIADECFDKDTTNCCRDSLKGYSKRVMDLMQERGIKGPRGIIDSASYVMRDALQGKKWWANKSK